MSKKVKSAGKKPQHERSKKKQIEQKVVTAVPDKATIVLDAAKEVADPRKIIDAALRECANDPGAMLEASVIDALRAVRADDLAAYTRYRALAKKANKAISLTDLDKLTKSGGLSEPKVMDLLIALATDRCKLSHDSDNRGVAIIEAGDHREVWMVKEAGFEKWLRTEYFNAHEEGVPDNALKSAITTIDAIAVNRGDLVDVHKRYAKHEDSYVIDLCDPRWRVIQVDAEGYRVLDRSSVLFTRNDGMRPLPEPVEGGEMEMLWKYANVPSMQRPLVLAFLLDSMRPETPFPVLEIVGEQGSAKSTTQRRLRDLLDPSKVPLRGRPGSVEDIFVTAANNWVVSYENLSGLPAEMQDALCTVSTGGGHATRKFYTNGEEHVIEAKRPVMLNGITGIATRPDLIERIIRVDAPQITAAVRREESDLEREWAQDYPRIFAAQLKMLAAVLKLMPKVKLNNRQRMADFERLGEAMMMFGGHSAGSFAKLYAEAQKEGTERALESYGVASALQLFVDEQKQMRAKAWNGTVGDLFNQLSGRPGDRSNWPRSAKGLGDQLRRLAPALRGQGLTITIGDKLRMGRQITLSWDTVATTGIHASPRPDTGAPADTLENPA